MEIPKPRERTLFFTTQVDQVSISGLSSNIISINENDEHIERVMGMYGYEYKRQPIKIYIDSFGGAVYQVAGLMGIMEHSKTPIHTIVTGAAMSAGFLILISGHKRFAYKYATPLYHSVSHIMSGTVQQLDEKLDETKRLQKFIENITLKRTKIKKDKLKEIKKSKVDWYMTPEEALELGVIDEII